MLIKDIQKTPASLHLLADDADIRACFITVTVQEKDNGFFFIYTFYTENMLIGEQCAVFIPHAFCRKEYLSCQFAEQDSGLLTDSQCFGETACTAFERTAVPDTDIVKKLNQSDRQDFFVSLLIHDTDMLMIDTFN